MPLVDSVLPQKPGRVVKVSDDGTDFDFVTLKSNSTISTTTATATAQTTLWTGSVAADELTAHKVYCLKGCGLLNTHSAGQVANISIDLGSTEVIVLTTPSAVKATNTPWYFEVFMTIRTVGETGTASTHGNLMCGTSQSYAVTESTAVDTTVINAITVKASWAAEDADNWLKLTQCWFVAVD